MGDKGKTITIEQWIPKDVKEFRRAVTAYLRPRLGLAATPYRGRLVAPPEFLEQLAAGWAAELLGARYPGFSLSPYSSYYIYSPVPTEPEPIPPTPPKPRPVPPKPRPEPPVPPRPEPPPWPKPIPGPEEISLSPGFALNIPTLSGIYSQRTLPFARRRGIFTLLSPKKRMFSLLPGFGEPKPIPPEEPEPWPEPEPPGPVPPIPEPPEPPGPIPPVPPKPKPRPKPIPRYPTGRITWSRDIYPYEWRLTREAISPLLLTGMPTTWQPAYRAAVEVAKRNIERATKRLAERFRMKGLRWSTALAERGARVAAEEMAKLNQYLMDLAWRAEEAARARQLATAPLMVGIGERYAELPERRLRLATGIGATLRDIAQQELAARYREALRLMPETSPWLQLALQWTRIPMSGPVGYKPGWFESMGGLRGIGSILAGLALLA